MSMDPITAGIDLIGKAIDRFVPDPAQRDAAKLAMYEAQRQGDMDAVKVAMSAILAEASSSDPWTSRARPSFLYLFYSVIVFLVMIAPSIGVFYPERMAALFSNVAAGFGAIPEPMWWTFSTGYLGYTAARQYGKTMGTDR